LNNGDTLPGGWNADWYPGALVLRADDLVLDGYYICEAIDSTGTNLTITNSVIVGHAGSFYGVFCRAGTLTITDTTVFRVDPSSDTDTGSGTLNGYAIHATRCDLSGYGDGIDCAPGSTISQCWVHDMALVGDTHVDGISTFNDNTGSAVLVEHSWVDVRGPYGTGSDGVHQNSAITLGDRNGTATVPFTPTINNNFLAGGGWIFRMEGNTTGDLHNGVITNNDFGPLDATMTGLVTVDSSSLITTWTNNRDSSGGSISQP
jgi:hypothetical protein